MIADVITAGLLAGVLVVQIARLRVDIQILDELRVIAARIQELRNRWHP